MLNLDGMFVKLFSFVKPSCTTCANSVAIKWTMNERLYAPTYRDGQEEPGTIFLTESERLLHCKAKPGFLAHYLKTGDTAVYLIPCGEYNCQPVGSTWKWYLKVAMRPNEKIAQQPYPLCSEVATSDCASYRPSPFKLLRANFL